MTQNKMDLLVVTVLEMFQKLYKVNCVFSSDRTLVVRALLLNHSLLHQMDHLRKMKITMIKSLKGFQNSNIKYNLRAITLCPNVKLVNDEKQTIFAFISTFDETEYSLETCQLSCCISFASHNVICRRMSLYTFFYWKVCQ